MKLQQKIANVRTFIFCSLAIFTLIQGNVFGIMLPDLGSMTLSELQEYYTTVQKAYNEACENYTQAYKLSQRYYNIAQDYK